MTLFLATKLTVEQCTEHLNNAIDPIPPRDERVRSANNTTWRPDPLPDAGWRMDGFGYSPGTRPVVGTIGSSKFHFEKRVVHASFGNGPKAPPVISSGCNGRLLPAAYGTLIEVDLEQPSSNVAFVFITGLFAVIFGLACVSLLVSYLSGTYPTAPTSHGDHGAVMGPCILVMMFLVPLAMTLVGVHSGQEDGKYLLKFVRQVCEATLLDAAPEDATGGYTGKTQRLS
jgi:hypothetical protein